MADRGTQIRQGIDQRGIDQDFPLLYVMAIEYDFAERLGGCSSALHAEVDKALRELWMARAQRRRRNENTASVT